MDFYDKLLEDTLKRHFNFCIKYRNYKDAFYLVSSHKLKNVTFKIREIVQEKKYSKRIEQIRIYRNYTRVIFKNGSFIDVCVANNGSRGRKSYGAIIDLEIDDKVVDFIINPTLIHRIRRYPRIIEKIADKLNIALPYVVKNDDYRPRVDYITVKGEI